jgi:hypothetical protein
MLKRFLTALALIGALVVPALAQPNPTFGVISGYAPKQTYSAVFIGLAPTASTTDLICIAGSSSKTIQLLQIKLSGSAGTTLSLPVTVLRRTALDTGGTAASTTANPANTISRRVTTNGAPTATLVSYTANPTINDTSPTYIDSAQLAVSLTTMATVSIPVEFNWDKQNNSLTQPPTIRNGQTTQQICVNLNATSLASGLLTGSITWTEE